ncbi:MAG TPA: hypothetical protein PLA61_14175 [Ferruginibacter sp.]|nr:hypothetical protein [Ferruginibacter sp.]
MQQTIERIRQLFSTCFQEPVTGMDKLPQAGSERHYFRIHTANKTYIATYGENLKENETFIYFSKK